MNRHTAAVLVAAGGAAAYALSKVHLALRGELGMPGFPAPPEAYEVYEPVSGQLSNAAMGAVMVLFVLALLRPPAGRLWRRPLLVVNGAGALLIGVGVLMFAARATGLSPGLGEPAQGAAAWTSLAVGAVWAVAWIVAVATTRAPDRS
ncbi:hypothetical protein DFP74_1954 [Nocardiopsis sp. Huas11]|uniref:hypothetical protein n=1 Tax=Nocardiopsis sp. Huas11 TaxID=2183912 RepID=UPI000EAE4C2E|nr:hypothetical protein [Nocardiopsis sp. Huas11]RKS06326.1 hypothetical protein DFP74_1954 [Nocardiopsis sp. Huas11]